MVLPREVRPTCSASAKGAKGENNQTSSTSLSRPITRSMDGKIAVPSVRDQERACSRALLGSGILAARSRSRIAGRGLSAHLAGSVNDPGMGGWP